MVRTLIHVTVPLVIFPRWRPRLLWSSLTMLSSYTGHATSSTSISQIMHAAPALCSTEVLSSVGIDLPFSHVVSAGVVLTNTLNSLESSQLFTAELDRTPHGGVGIDTFPIFCFDGVAEI